MISQRFSENSNLVLANRAELMSGKITNSASNDGVKIESQQMWISKTYSLGNVTMANRENNSGKRQK